MSKAPYYIRALIEVHVVANPDVSKQSLEELAKDDLIKQYPSGSWTTTPKGQAYINMLCNLPLPVCAWVSPPVDRS